MSDSVLIVKVQHSRQLMGDLYYPTAVVEDLSISSGSIRSNHSHRPIIPGPVIAELNTTTSSS